uniref:Uncharacterized protein n=1 Tax=Arundo donax TaxID=35708 RepID=A0A0A9AD90_ARUDO
MQSHCHAASLEHTKNDNLSPLHLAAGTGALEGGPHLLGKVPEHVLLNLAGGGFGQLGAEDHRFGHHVVRHALPAPRDDAGRGHRAHRALLEAHECARRLPPELVRPRHHGRLVHRRVPVEHGLDLHAADILTAADDHVLGPVPDLQVPVGMHHADVTRVEPPVVAYRCLGRLVVVQVAEHDAPAAEHDLAHRGAVAGHAAAGLVVDDVDLGHGRRAHALPRLEPCALRSRELVPLSLPRARHHQARGLAEPVPVADLEANGLRAVQHGCRRRRAGREDAHLPRERLPHALGGVGQHVEHDGRATEVRDPAARDGGVHLAGVDPTEADVGATHHGHPPREAPAVGVEHRQRPKVRWPRRHSPVHERVHGDQEDPAVAVHHALGRRRRAGGVVQYHRVPLACRPHPRELRVALLKKPLVRQGLGSGGGELLLVGVLDGDDARRRVPRREKLERIADERQRRRVDEDELGAGVAEQDGDRARVEARVDGVEHGAAHGHAEVHLVHGRHVGQEHRHDVAAGDAEGDERGGEAEASAEGLGPGEDRVVVDDGGAVAEHRGRALQEAQRRERARVRRIRAEPVHAAGGGVDWLV